MFGHAVAAAGAAAAGPAGVALLQGLVMFGALLYVFGKGAKFSLFKPAEEMVYITLDEDGRTRGKAAIDVVGAQVRGAAPVKRCNAGANDFVLQFSAPCTVQP
jgi:ATP/ADP translocase